MPITRKHGIAALAAVSVALLLAACSSGDDTDPSGSGTENAEGSSEGYAVDSDTLVFGSVPASESASSTYEPIEEYIAQITGKNVEYFEASDYVALIEAAVAGQIDFAAFSGFTYYQAIQAGAQIEPFAAVIAEEGAEAGYYSVAVANPNSGIETIEDFRGHTICFVNPNSTSGYLYPSYALLEAGIDPSESSTDITVVFAGNHDASLLAIQTGECDAGFAEDVTTNPAVEDGSVVEVTRTFVAGPPFVVSSTLPDDVKQQIIDALSEVTIQDLVDAGIESAETNETFQDVFWGTEPVDDGYYDTIRDLCAIVTTAEACQQ